jgi:hypothetical protein
MLSFLQAPPISNVSATLVKRSRLLRRSLWSTTMATRPSRCYGLRLLLSPVRAGSVRYRIGRDQHDSTSGAGDWRGFLVTNIGNPATLTDRVTAFHRGW